MTSSGTGSQGAFSVLSDDEEEASEGETCSFMGHWSDRGKLDHQNQQKSLFLLLLALLACTSSNAALLPSAGSMESRRAGPLMAILQHWPQGSYRLDKHLLQPANTELPVGLLSPFVALPLLLPF